MSLVDAFVDLVRRRRPLWATRRALVTGGVLAAIALSAFALLAVRAGTIGPRPELVIPVAGIGAGPGVPAGGAPGPEAGVAGAGGSGTGEVAVHAAGAFVAPGLYTLEAGARVADLVEAAGGPAPGAVLDALNLAARLTDGERIYLPRHDEITSPLGVAAGGGVSGSASTGEPTIVDLNTATLEQLDSLPGVGPSTARAILEYRREHGRFRSVEELLEVRGIGEAKLASIRSRVRV